MGIRAVAVVVVVAVAVLAGSARRAVAEEKPNPVFAGRILLSDRSFPAQGKNLTKYNEQLKKQCQHSFVEETQWKIHYAAFLRAPLAGTRYTIKLYDTTGGRKRMLVALKKNATARGLTMLSSELSLQGSVLGTNRRLLMTVENNGDVLSEVAFEILDQPAPEEAAAN